MLTENTNNLQVDTIKADCREFLNIENEIPTKNIPTKQFLNNQILPIIKDIENIITGQVNNIIIEHSLNHIALTFSTPRITTNRFSISVDNELETLNFESHVEYLFSEFNAIPLAQFELSPASIWFEFGRFLSRRNDEILNLTFEDEDFNFENSAES